MTNESPVVLQVRDISQSGLQFFTNLRIDQSSPLSISWTDEMWGSIDSYVIVTRQISQPTFKLYKYCYGSQFINLRSEAKESIIKVVGYIEKDELRLQRKIIESLNSDSLLQIIQQGRSFIQNIKNANSDTSKLFSKMMRSWQEYEVDSFTKTDIHSQWIQKLTANHFHCSLLRMILPVFPLNHPIGMETFRQSAIKLEQVPKIMSEATKFLGTKQKKPGDFNVEKQMIMECLNRLSYRRFELLKTLIDTATSSSEIENDQRKNLKKILEDYSGFISSLELEKEIKKLQLSKSKIILAK